MSTGRSPLGCRGVCGGRSPYAPVGSSSSLLPARSLHGSMSTGTRAACLEYLAHVHPYYFGWRSSSYSLSVGVRAIKVLPGLCTDSFQLSGLQRARKRQRHRERMRGALQCCLIHLFHLSLILMLVLFCQEGVPALPTLLPNAPLLPSLLLCMPSSVLLPWRLCQVHVIEQASLRHRCAVVLAFPHAVLVVLVVIRFPQDH